MDAARVLALYDRHARELLGFFTRRTRDPHLALDLALRRHSWPPSSTAISALAASER